MELKLLSVALLLTVLVASTQADVPLEEYWKSVLPSTRMPKAIKDILYRTNATNEDGGTSVPDMPDVGVKPIPLFYNDYADTNEDGGTSVPDMPDVGVKPLPNILTYHHYAATNEDAVSSDVANGPEGTSVGVGKGGESVKPVPNLFSYHYHDTNETLPPDDPRMAIFFLEKDLKQGKTMTLQFAKFSNEAAFLPREIADTKPFSSNRLPEIYSMYMVKPNSIEAETMKNTIKDCEAPGIEGEEKYCATSLESMIEFAKSNLGKDIKAVSTEVTHQTSKQKYTITGEARRVVKKKSVACHKLNYPYAVFYCHQTPDTRLYVVPMECSDGTSVKAVVACHTDTSKWNPKHLAFQILKVHPGTIPICHFLPEDHLVWFNNPNTWDT